MSFVYFPSGWDETIRPPGVLLASGAGLFTLVFEQVRKHLRIQDMNIKGAALNQLWGLCYSCASSRCRPPWSHRLAWPRTEPSQGSDTGSNPVGTTIPTFG
ncbi:protein of unknown function [Nitrospira japonica]|uniref:Uncharacterized protein n=1 Tax=Nitrospira japonica TaxID=1325564 RepID=A0A1W1I1M9_9BACT|nr:protein of unknown function [Nitrospira japonica]